jgi:hypothetical protein
MIETKKLLVKLAAYYEKKLSDEQIQIYAEQLNEALTSAELSHACKLYINDPTNEFFPRPVSKLIHLIRQPISANDEAVSIADRVVEAISRFGWANEAEAMSFIGEAGKAAVRRNGGWNYLCSNLGTNLDIGQFRAQCRDGVKANIQITKVSERPQIEQKQILHLISNMTKEIPK